MSRQTLESAGLIAHADLGVSIPLRSSAFSGAVLMDDRKSDASAEQGAADSFAVKAPTLSLPKGGGAIRGMGEKFAANPVTGTGAMSVPIGTSPGRGGFGPQLSLSYDSGAGNGPFGLGW
ncbi:MAG: SpvB/TcaC N-terminal domain-containing protein, partial [Hylemonella sp.]